MANGDIAQVSQIVLRLGPNEAMILRRALLTYKTTDDSLEGIKLTLDARVRMLIEDANWVDLMSPLERKESAKERKNRKAREKYRAERGLPTVAEDVGPTEGAYRFPPPVLVPPGAGTNPTFNMPRLPQRNFTGNDDFGDRLGWRSNGSIHPALDRGQIEATRRGPLPKDSIGAEAKKLLEALEAVK